MAALILPSRRVVQPQGPVEVDWGNPLAQGLVFALNPASGERNLATPKQAVTLSPLVLSNSTSGKLVGTGAAEYEVTADLTKNLTLFSVWRSREGSQYFAADGERAVFSARTAGNQGWIWSRPPAGQNAIAGGATGNITRQQFTLNGIAAYVENNYGIESLVDSPVAVRYVRATGVISWFNKGFKSSPDTSASTAGTNGSNLIFRRQGPYASNLQPFIDRTGASYVWNRALSDAEIALVSENPWQLFRPIQRRIWVPVAGGGAVSLTVADASQAHTAENVVLTSATALTLADALHAQSAENVALSVDVALTVQDAAHAQTAESVVLSAVETLTIADAEHAQSAENVTLTVGGIGLTVADAAHAQAADSVALSADSFLITADGSHGQAADLVTLSTATFFAVDDTVHAQTADNLTLDGAPVLGVSDSLHGQIAESVALTMESWLAAANAAHAQTAQNVTLTVTGDDVPETYPLAGLAQDFPLAGQAQTYPLG